MAQQILENPFPGLRPFESGEDYLFFGRRGQSDELLKRLRLNRFLAVLGVSGSGKSSLIRAGLLPALRAGFMVSAGSTWKIAVFRPGENPIRNMALALNRAEVFGATDEDAEFQAAITEATLRRSALGLVETIRQLRRPGDENLLVVVDQFEELFRFKLKSDDDGAYDEASAFVKLILEAVHQDQLPIFVAITMRSDFLGDCAQFRDLPETINNSQYLIPRMTRDQRREAITRPVAVGVGNISPRLVNRLLNDVGDNPDQLPILQHALMRTWDYWSDDHEPDEPLDLRHYEAIGGMDEALSRHAEEAFADLPDDRSREIAQRMFKLLTEKGADNREVRRPILLSQICSANGAAPEEVDTVVENFRRPGRSFLMPPASVALRQNLLIDISHESLIRGWGRLKEWVEEEAQSAQIYRRLAETAVLNLKGLAGLWRDPDLQIALAWRERTQPAADWAVRYHPAFDEAMRFLEASQKERDQEEAAREAQRAREVRRTRLFAAVLGIAFLISLGVGLYAVSKERDANQQRRRAEESRYAADMRLAQQAADEGNLGRTIDLLQRYRSGTGDDSLCGFEWRYLWWIAEGESIATFHGHRDEVRSVAFSPDGNKLATGSTDATVSILDVIAQRTLTTFKVDGPGVMSVAFSPDGQTLAVATGNWKRSGEKGKLYLWDVEREAFARTLEGHTRAINSVTFSPNGKFLASGSEDNTVMIWKMDAEQAPTVIAPPGFSLGVNAIAISGDSQLLAAAYGDGHLLIWDINSGRELSSVIAHVSGIMSMVFSPDGKTIVVGTRDGPILLWSVNSEREPLSVNTKQGLVNALAFSYDGKLLATGGSNCTIKLWDFGSMKELTTLIGHKDMVFSVAFSPKGNLIASGGNDRMVKLWDSSKGRTVSTLHHNGAVSDVAFSPDGKTVATTVGISSSDSVNNQARVFLWDRDSLSQIAAIGKEHTGAVYSVAFSPDGKTLATGSMDHTAMLWDAATHFKLATLAGHTEPVTSVAFSPDSKILATASRDKFIKLWNVAGNQSALIATLEGHDGWVRSVAFSPDGTMLASASSDRTVRLWDVASRKQIAVFEGYQGACNSVAFSPDSSILASGSNDRTVRLWDLVDKQHLPTSATILQGYSAAINSLEFSPDGRTLAAGSQDSSITLWNVRTRQEVMVFNPHLGGILSVTFSPDGNILATSSNDGTAKLWRALTGPEIETLNKNQYEWAQP